MKRILWIEDDYKRLKGLMRPLLKRGYEVDYALDYPEFRKKKKKDNYDLYVVDLILPQKEIGEIVDESEYVELAGLNIVEELKDEKKPILVLTVVGDPGILVKLGEVKSVKKILSKGAIFPSDFAEDVIEILDTYKDE